MTYHVWYMKPEWFVDGTFGQLPDSKNLEATHVHLGEVAGESLDEVWKNMQAEMWSPKGEARALIESKGLKHTSMSVGDVIVDEAGAAHVVASIGFKELS